MELKHAALVLFAVIAVQRVAAAADPSPAVMACVTAAEEKCLGAFLERLGVNSSLRSDHNATSRARIAALPVITKAWRAACFDAMNISVSSFACLDRDVAACNPPAGFRARLLRFKHYCDAQCSDVASRLNTTFTCFAPIRQTVMDGTNAPSTDADKTAFCGKANTAIKCANKQTKESQCKMIGDTVKGVYPSIKTALLTHSPNCHLADLVYVDGDGPESSSIIVTSSKWLMTLLPICGFYIQRVLA